MPELWRRLCRIVFPPLNAIHRHSLQENPLRILELGAGTGKFSYLFLRKLTALLRGHNVPLHLVRYCMTDASEKPGNRVA